MLSNFHGLQNLLLTLHNLLNFCNVYTGECAAGDIAPTSTRFKPFMT